MTTHDITVRLPEPLYERIKQRANQSHRTIEAELVQLVSEVVPTVGERTAELSELLDQLSHLDNKLLWRVARSHLSKKALTRLQTLNYKRQRESLTEDEAKESNVLLRQYERSILLRAKAILLLKERKQDISEFDLEE